MDKGLLQRGGGGGVMLGCANAGQDTWYRYITVSLSASTSSHITDRLDCDYLLNEDPSLLTLQNMLLFWVRQKAVVQREAGT